MQHVWPKPQTSCSWVSAKELPTRKGAVKRKYHTGLRRVWNKHLAQSQTVLQLQASCTVHVFFWQLKEQPLPWSLSCTLASTALGPALMQHPARQQLQLAQDQLSTTSQKK